jgi:1-pyrroline-5-carboxylate dehydrogenase
MSSGNSQVPLAVNEPVLNYAPGSQERIAIKKALEDARSVLVEIPQFIGGKEVKTGNLVAIHPPHDIHHLLGHYHKGDETHVQQAINAALEAKGSWEAMPWKQRAAIFLKAADLIAGPYRSKINAATMLGQSKNVFQAEIDSACELADFLRFNVQYMSEIYDQQPYSPRTFWNSLEHRPLEGFIFALTPFNFTAISGNLPSAPALMGNTVVWKPSNTQIYSASVIMEIFKAAGLPGGVINLIYVSGPVAGKVIFSHPDFAGLHYTGSTKVFEDIWKTIGENIHLYKTYPRIVGETGGKDFIMVHPSAKTAQVATAIIRGAFEYQGQKCSAASRAYIPRSMWEGLKAKLITELDTVKMGGVEDFSNFMNAVIDEASFTNIAGFIERAKKDPQVEVVYGGGYDKSKGYFVQPTVLSTKNPQSETMVEEIFGPVITIYVYEDAKYAETLDLVNSTSKYALTGAIFATDRMAIEMANTKLKHAAGNFYINDKPTGAVVGQQPFGGSRKSGTNDKAGSSLNLLRWTSPQAIKETFVTPENYQYPFMLES